MQLLHSGALPDDLPEQLAAHPTFVVAADEYTRYPPRLKQLLDQHYLRAGTLCVAGQRLAAGPAQQGESLRFSVAVPGRYAIVAGNRLLSGALNGVPGNGVFELLRGPQQFVPAAAAPPPTLVWAKAWQRGLRTDGGA